jgi:hypothetical protein
MSECDFSVNLVSWDSMDSSTRPDLHLAQQASRLTSVYILYLKAVASVQPNGCQWGENSSVAFVYIYVYYIAEPEDVLPFHWLVTGSNDITIQSAL